MPYSIKRDAVRARLARLLMGILIFADLLGPITSKVLRSPSTGIAGIAAHVIEQEVEIEVEKFEEVEMDSSRVKKGAINAAPRNEDAI
ncbi:hypothetical protein LWI29_032500 [Acer saccharum]|uniref:Uncharacterized protein n=1 Tax=Acer saccharum TaxID=4024 RepID=A0AA39SII0_ACESA|nr:hypothetical protein LWI29_032500 [Acer saccharum]